MKDKQIKKLVNQQDINNFLNKNKHNWSNIIELEHALTTFDINIQKIVELKKEQEKDTSGLLKEKADKRTDLIGKAVPVSNVLQVYAYDNGDNSLSKKITFSKNKLTKSRDSVLVEKVDLIIKVANQLYNKSLYSESSKKGKKTINIANYGITKTLIEDLASENLNFSQTILKLKEALAYKNKCSKKITEKLKTNNTILGNKIDKLLTLFELSNKSFYDAYKKIRGKEKEQKVTIKQTDSTQIEETVQTPSEKEENTNQKSIPAANKPAVTKRATVKKTTPATKTTRNSVKANSTVSKSSIADSSAAKTNTTNKN
jgi:hypothetical protein